MQQGKDKPKKKIPHDIKWKRQQLAKRRRKLMVRLIAVAILLLLMLSVLLFIGYKVVGWGMNLYGQYQTQYAGYQQRQEAWRGDVNPVFDGYTNVLVMGLDDGVDTQGEGDERADAVLVMSLNNHSGEVRFINIPADTWVNVPNSTAQNKLKNLYAMGGAPLMTRSVNELLGVSIHQYVALDMSALSQLIDALGGIDLYVEKDMDYDDAEGNISIHLKQGYQHLTGAQALSYLRYRGDDMGDMGRVERQQKFVKALYNQAISLDTVPKLPIIAEILKTKVTMSTEIFDSAHLLNVLRHLQTGEPTSILLPGTPSPYDDTIFLPNATGIQQKMQELFPETVNDDDNSETNSN